MSKREEWLKGKRKNYENSISDIVPGLLNNIIDGKQKARADFLLNWHKIFGRELDDMIVFEDLQAVSKKDRRYNLKISTSPKDFLEVTHMKETIKEKAAIYFGYNLIEQVKITKK